MSYSPFRKYVIFAAIVAVVMLVLFANRVVQSNFGKQAREAVQIETLPLPAALAKAQAHDKWVLADMSAIWCPTCRKLDQQVFANPKVKQFIESNFIFARVDYESAAGDAFMRQYNVQGFPVLLILNGQGDKLTKLPITLDPNDFIGNLNTFIHHASNG